MPYSITRTDTLLTITVSGVVTDDDFRCCVADVRAIVSEAPDLHELVDLRGVRGLAVKTETIRETAVAPPLFSARSRQAAVAAGDLGFGMSRMYEMLVDLKRPNMHVFRSLDEAMAWLAQDE